MVSLLKQDKTLVSVLTWLAGRFCQWKISWQIADRICIPASTSPHHGKRCIPLRMWVVTRLLPGYSRVIDGYCMDQHLDVLLVIGLRPPFMVVFLHAHLRLAENDIYIYVYTHTIILHNTYIYIYRIHTICMYI